MPKTFQPAAELLAQGKIHRVDPDFGSTLTVFNRDSHSNCWVNLKIVGQPCEFQVPLEEKVLGRKAAPRTRSVRTLSPGGTRVHPLLVESPSVLLHSHNGSLDVFNRSMGSMISAGK